MQAQREIITLVENIEKAIIGKRQVILRVVAALLAGGHILVEDVPGVGKTQMVSALSRSVRGVFHRVQMTPDVMPADIVGYSMIHPESKKIVYQKGAVYCNFFLADEINRASPKAQSGLLEVMEERQISVEGGTIPLPRPFMVLATQNPVETYGTYHLPEAQMDRFLMRIVIGYPNKEKEMQILNEIEGDNPLNNLEAVLSLEDVERMQQESQSVTANRLIKEYIWEIVNATRHDENIRLGVSPRGALALQRAAKAMAYINMRDYVIPDDVRDVAAHVLAHRLILSPKGKNGLASREQAVMQVLERVGVPAAVVG
ncbi:MAG: MoxR family ATPase [Gracilibacteraceae bacterium]|jgi:MoxR-like ATPase|nr:MoxR family ATPase [Gracilibacteraceae bacterium]